MELHPEVARLERNAARLLYALAAFALVLFALVIYLELKTNATNQYLPVPAHPVVGPAVPPAGAGGPGGIRVRRLPGV